MRESAWRPTAKPWTIRVKVHDSNLKMSSGANLESIRGTLGALTGEAIYF